MMGSFADSELSRLTSGRAAFAAAGAPASIRSAIRSAIHIEERENIAAARLAVSFPAYTNQERVDAAMAEVDRRAAVFAASKVSDMGKRIARAEALESVAHDVQAGRI